jgi:hypothetical protein
VSAHTRDEDDAPAALKLDHILRDCLRGHEDPRNIDRKHPIRIFLRVNQCRRLLLDARCRNQSIEAAMLVRNVVDDFVQCWDVTDVDLAVVERGAEFLFCVLCDLVEVWGWFWEPVEGIH